MNGDNDNNQIDDFENLLDDLYSLQESLIEGRTAKDIELPKEEIDTDLDSLDIPILTESLDAEIDKQQQPAPTSTEVQHHLFEETPEPPAKPQLDEQQVEAIVDKVVARSLPALEEKLRQRVREKVLARMQQPD